MAGREKLCLSPGAGKQQSLETIRRDAPLFFQRWAHRAGFLRGLPAFSSPKFPAAHPSGAQPLRFNTQGCKTSAGAAVQLPPSSTRHQLRRAFPRTQPETRPPHPHGNGNQPTPWTASPPPRAAQHPQTAPNSNVLAFCLRAGCRLVCAPSFSASAPPALK